MLFQNKIFRYLFLSYGVSLLGSSFSTIAINFWVLETTGSARIMFVFFMVVLAINVLFGGVAGTFADRYDRRTIMWVCDLLNAAIIFVVAACMYTSFTSIPFLIVLFGLQVFIGLFHGPAFQASLSNIVEKENMSKATGAITIMDNISRISGLALGGLFIGLFGSFTAFLVNTCTYILSAGFVLMAGVIPQSHLAVEHDGKLQEKKSFFKDFKEGLQLLVKEPFIRSVLILFPILGSSFTMALMMIQVTAVQTWKAKGWEFGLIEACIPFGYILGSLVIMKLDTRIQRKGYWIFGGFLLIGPIYYCISEIEYISYVYPFIILLGFMFAVSTLLVNIALRVQTAPAIQGRVFGFLGMLHSVFGTIAVGVGTFFADIAGPQTVLAVTSLALMILALVLTATLKPLRELGKKKPKSIVEVGV
ncbi:MULTISPECIES: MFS transporter [Ectobacillus]|jgi:DHA3 family macrolide efflux protein-like MFS transporter|uniref:MFS transporter n=1 Tax=Ectobacillus TaxID=2837502 RepID=UPI000F597433|nr:MULTISPECIES: MFS transporter [Ectobacillus]UOY91949.1 MFS transporter [Ectobacillus sp. JY-23]